MNIENLNNTFSAIVEKKQQLAIIPKINKEYQVVEEELDSLVSDFIEKYGSYMEEAIFNVHDEFCPDNDVMQLLAYVADQYIKQNDRMMIAPVNAGIEVHCDDYPDVKTRLVLEPNPIKLVIQGENRSFREVVWVAR